MSDLLTDIGDTADLLCNPSQHTETFRKPGRDGRLRHYAHTTILPSLLDQLAEAVIPGSCVAEGQQGGYESQPPARLDAVDRLLAIEAGSARWCMSLHVALREDAAANIRGMVGAAGGIDSDTQRVMLAELRAWLTWAKVVTGWISPPWRPTAPCPACDTKALRVRLDTATAACMACGAAWDERTIGLLAEHVRTARKATV